MSALILYTTEDGHSQIKLRAKDQTVWLTQREMAQLFDVSTHNVGLHLKNILEDGELDVDSVVKESLTAQMQSGHQATVKQSLTVRGGPGRAPTPEESSVVQERQP